jgi:predicted solute-binding protein
MIDVVRTVYTYCNQQREKYRLFDLPILEFDTRWNLYCFQMQDLLKEWYEKKGGSQRFKTFRDKKREIDSQWLRLLEEMSQKYSTNFATIYQEILEKNLKLNFRKVESLWRRSFVCL